MLTVIGDVFVRGKYSFVVCRCDCGAQKTVSASAMARGVVKSCGGCSLLAANSFKHGMSRTREHRAWCSMIERCENKHCKAYKNYGARGIYVCERWHDFSAFYSDVGDRRAGLSIDRIDNDGGYTCGNHRECEDCDAMNAPRNWAWSTGVEQVKNRRNSIAISCDGDVKSLREWCDILGARYKTAWAKISRGATIAESLGAKVGTWAIASVASKPNTEAGEARIMARHLVMSSLAEKREADAGVVYTAENMPSDISGYRFWRYTVLSMCGDAHHRPNMVSARCDCGSVRTVSMNALLRGHTKSCGCMKNELLAARSTTHGHSSGRNKKPEFSVWCGMKKRCSNPNDVGYQNYGGRGIYVCLRWRRDFEAFISDIGDRPDGMSIERIDNNGSYTCGKHDLCDDCRDNNAPANCRWATFKDQMGNRRNTRFVLREGKRIALVDYCADSGLRYGVVVQRIYRGETMVSAISRPTHRARLTFLTAKASPQTPSRSQS